MRPVADGCMLQQAKCKPQHIGGTQLLLLTQLSAVCHCSLGASCQGWPMTPRTSSTSKLLLLGTRGKLPVLPVRLGFEGARYSVLRGLLASAPPSDAPFVGLTDASAAAEGPAAAARNAAQTTNCKERRDLQKRALRRGAAPGQTGYADASGTGAGGPCSPAAGATPSSCCCPCTHRERNGQGVAGTKAGDRLEHPLLGSRSTSTLIN
jgi:hypothetical protein